jgi:hypothetical protein
VDWAVPQAFCLKRFIFNGFYFIAKHTFNSHDDTPIYLVVEGLLLKDVTLGLSGRLEWRIVILSNGSLLRHGAYLYYSTVWQEFRM